MHPRERTAPVARRFATMKKRPVVAVRGGERILVWPREEPLLP